jgi:hypothetical protein
MCLLLCISARYDYPLLYPTSHRGEPSSYDGKCLLVQLCLSVRPERGTTDLRRLCKGLPSSNMHVSRADFFHRCKHSMRYGPRYTMADCRSDGELDCFLILISPPFLPWSPPLRRAPALARPLLTNASFFVIAARRWHRRHERSGPADFDRYRPPCGTAQIHGCHHSLRCCWLSIRRSLRRRYRRKRVMADVSLRRASLPSTDD